MKRFSKILFVHEPKADNEVAVHRAVEVARDNNAELTICSIGKELPVKLLNLESDFHESRKEQLAALLRDKQLDSVKHQFKILFGIPFIEIINQVQRESFDLVIKAAGGRGANYLFGVTDMQLMRKCPCPVWTFKPSSTPKFNTILAAVDTDPTHPENSALNQLILELAISLAQSDSSELIIVNAWHLEHEKYLRSNRVLLGDEEIDAMVVNIRESHQKWMDDLVSSNDFGSIKPGIMLKKGIPEEIIPKIAKESGAELIVMGTLSRTGIAGLFIGNTAEKTLNSVDCSVLTVKPGSFVSPVKSS